VLTNKGFIDWATEHVVVLVGHNDMGHEPVEEEGEDGTPREVCPLYPGLTCRQHRDLVVDLNNSRFEELPRVEFVSLQPNSWLVSPRLEVRRIVEEDQFTAGKIEAAAEALQKELGAPLPLARHRKMKAHLEAAESAGAKRDWKAAVAALAAFAKDAADVPEPLALLLPDAVAMLNVKVEEAFLVLRDGAEDAATRTKAVKALRAAASGRIGTETLPVLADVDAWLATPAK
jgi:hypothetical protein